MNHLLVLRHMGIITYGQISDVERLIWRQVEGFTRRERIVMVHRLGLRPEHPYTQTYHEIAQEPGLKITAERVRQIEAKFLRKLRRHEVMKELQQILLPV